MLVFDIACFSFTVSQQIRGYPISAEKPASISVDADFGAGLLLQ